MNRSFIIRIGLLLTAITAATAVTSAKVGAIPLEKFVDQSTFIGVVKVTSVRESNDGRRLATASIESVWKGAPATSVVFRCSPTWTCDAADAVPGERVLLFLGLYGNPGELQIAHSGCGRMPIRFQRGREIVQSRGMVLPARLLADVDTNKPSQSRTVDLARLKQEVTARSRK